VLHFVPDIGGCQVAEQPFEIIVNFDFVLVFAPVLPFDEIFVQIVDEEGFNEGRVLLLLVVPGGLPGIDENGWRQRGGEDLGLLSIIEVNVEEEEQIKLDA
jgi:hypothetical protein